MDLLREVLNEGVEFIECYDDTALLVIGAAEAAPRTVTRG